MTYRVTLAQSALRNLEGMPFTAVQALARRSAELIRNSWAQTPGFIRGEEVNWAG